MEQHTISDNTSIHSEVTPEIPVESGYDTLVHKNEDGQLSLSVLVSGVHCAGCIQKIESALGRIENITYVRLNFSTRRLSLSWAGETAQANAFVTLIESLGYNVQPYDPQTEKNTTAAEERFLLLCLGVAGFSMGNIMLLSVGLWTSSVETMGLATRDFLHWISAVIALPTILFSGRPFFRSALGALRAGHTNMDVPISLALTLAGTMSLFETIHHGEHVYFDSAVMLMFFLLIGRYLDFRAKKNARSTATDLLSTLSGFATVIEGHKTDKSTKRVLIRDLREDMIVQVHTGEKFPIDGILFEGQTEIDTSLVTGESIPRNANTGDDVYAGTLNLSAPVLVKVVKAAEDSLLSEIVRLMEKAGQGQARYVRMAEKAARLYTPVVHACAAVTFIGWWVLGGLFWQDALMISITVLIITCPCALGLAVPVVQVLATSRLMKHGILVKSGDALERLADIDTVLLDKTGTMTLGQPVLDGSYDDQDITIMASSLAHHSAHPLAKALAAHHHGSLIPFTNIREHAGKGMEGIHQGKTIRLGSRSWCGDDSAPSTDRIELWLSIEGEPPYPFYFTDTLRADTTHIIDKMRKNNLRPIMLTGDRDAVAKDIAKTAHITEYYAQKTPPQKFEIMEQMQQQGHTVLMIGDGLNDAPALAGADVSIAPGSAIDMAQNAADIIFMGEKLSPVLEAYQTSVMTQKLVKQNFILAVLYNMIAIPLAICGMVTPLVAAIAMSGSSLIVIANSFRLKIIQL